MDTDLWDLIDSRFRESDIGGAVKLLEARLPESNVDLFNELIGRGFTNSPKLILGSINDFIDACRKEFDIKAVYLEMNGFDVNPNRWFFDFFGYTQYEADPDDLEWLCEWQSSYWPGVTLTGLESVQSDFKRYHANSMWKDPLLKNAAEAATLLVMCKFVSLIGTALTAGRRVKRIPVLATAHDFDTVGRFE
jgi:hypothetical protein